MTVKSIGFLSMIFHQRISKISGGKAGMIMK